MLNDDDACSTHADDGLLKRFNIPDTIHKESVNVRPLLKKFSHALDTTGSDLQPFGYDAKFLKQTISPYEFYSQTKYLSTTRMARGTL